MQTNNDPNTHVISFVDTDGTAAAAVVKLRFPDAQVTLLGYGQRIPINRIFPGARIYVTDYRLPPTILRQLADEGHEIIWIDHHAEQERDYKEHTATQHLQIPGVRDASKSSSTLVWEHLFPNTQVPKILRWIDDYARWQFKLPETLWINYGLNCLRTIYPSDQGMAIWRNLFEDDSAMLRSILQNGKELVEFYDQVYKVQAEDAAYLTELDGHPVLAINGTFMSSRVFNSRTAELEKAHATVRYHWRQSQFKSELLAKYAIASVEHRADAGEIARKHGGNGTPEIGGWTDECLPFPQKERPGQTERYDQFFRHLEQQALKSPNLLLASLKRDCDMLIKAGKYGELGGHTYLAVNSNIPSPIIFEGTDRSAVEMYIAWAWVNCGKYRIVIHPVSMHLKLEELQKLYGGEMVGNSLWFYSDTNPIIADPKATPPVP